jgi:uncharacterized protein (TIGR02996 family)
MNQEEAFLQAIAEAPDDDVPRLVCADWLEEHGEGDRAEFIRLQCALDRPWPGEERAAELRRRAVQLLAEHEGRWLGEWANRLVRWTFRRGFLDAVVVTPDPFLRHGGDLFRCHPVRAVAFVNEFGTPVAGEAVAELAASPHFSNVRSLDATACPRDEPAFGMYSGRHPGEAWCQALAKAAHVTRLEELVLASGLRGGDDGTSPPAFADLAAAPHLHTLRSLDLTHVYPCSLGDEMVALLAGASFASNLESLVLDGTDLTDAGARRLSAATTLTRLRRLDLAGCPQVSAAGWQAVLGAAHLSQLDAIGLGARGDLLQVLASSPRLSAITALRMTQGYMGLGDSPDRSDWARLASSPGLQLDWLDLSGGVEEGGGLEELLASPGLAGLEQLRVGVPFRHAGTEPAALWRSPVGPRLTAFAWAQGWGMGDEESLPSWPGLRRLNDLELADGGAGREGDVGALLDSPQFPGGLTRLHLDGLSEDELVALAGCPKLGALRWLALPFSAWTAGAMQALLDSPHLRDLEALHLGSEDAESLLLLARSSRLPRLRDVVVGSGTAREAQDELRKRFGSRLRIFADC